MKKVTNQLSDFACTPTWCRYTKSSALLALSLVEKTSSKDHVKKTTTYTQLSYAMRQNKNPVHNSNTARLFLLDLVNKTTYTPKTNKTLPSSGHVGAAINMAKINNKHTGSYIHKCFYSSSSKQKTPSSKADSASASEKADSASGSEKADSASGSEKAESASGSSLSASPSSKNAS